MLEPLFDAIYSRFLATPFAAELTDLYNTEADDEAIMPYGTFSLPDNTPDWAFTDRFENCTIQFSLFSETPTCKEITDAATALKAAFDFFDLVVIGFTTVSMTRGVASLFKVKGKWQYNVIYEIKIQND